MEENRHGHDRCKNQDSLPFIKLLCIKTKENVTSLWLGLIDSTDLNNSEEMADDHNYCYHVIYYMKHL